MIAQTKDNDNRIHKIFMIKQSINCEYVEAKAKCMSANALQGAIEDILITLKFADAMDHEDQGNRGGYYRDELSVYRSELKRR